MTFNITSSAPPPIEVRRKLGINPGTKVDVVISDDDRVEIIPLTNSIKNLKGMVPKPSKTLSLEEMDKAISDGLKL